MSSLPTTHISLTLSQVESFWSLWTHLASPSNLQPTTDYLLFHTGVRRPVWEDHLNISGGKWIIRLRKGVADRLWEDLVLAIIGDQFDQCGNGPVPTNGENEEEDDSSAAYNEICGCTISVRQNEDIISLWNRYEADFKVRERIRSDLICLYVHSMLTYGAGIHLGEFSIFLQPLPWNTKQTTVGLPFFRSLNPLTLVIDSMLDQSSFRTTGLHDRTPHT